MSAYQSSAWKKERAAYFREHPMCERCGEPGRIVHHLDEEGVHGGGALETLCMDHHNKVTAEARKRARGVRPS